MAAVTASALFKAAEDWCCWDDDDKVLRCKICCEVWAPGYRKAAVVVVLYVRAVF